MCGTKIATFKRRNSVFVTWKNVTKFFVVGRGAWKKINYVQHCLPISHLWKKSHAFACVRCSSHGILFSSANLDWWKILHQEFLFFCLLIIKLLFHIMCLSYLCLLLPLFLPVHSFKSSEYSASTETKLFHNGWRVSECRRRGKKGRKHVRLYFLLSLTHSLSPSVLSCKYSLAARKWISILRFSNCHHQLSCVQLLERMHTIKSK